MELFAPRFEAANLDGHYESWFLRGHHPTRPLSFWNRYTVFSPKGDPKAATIGLWSTWFDGERNEVISVHKEFPIADGFLGTRIIEAGGAWLSGTTFKGVIEADNRIAWNVMIARGQEPVLFLPSFIYKLPFPPAKSLVIDRDVQFNGSFSVNGAPIDIENWTGTLNHNWGSRQTDEYAWGQVVYKPADCSTSRDNVPGVFFECLTAKMQLPFGKKKTPWTTVGVLRMNGWTHRLLSFHKGCSPTAPYSSDHWQFKAYGFGLVVEGEFMAPGTSFTQLEYQNPPGGVKTCRNSGLASAVLHVWRFGKKYTFTSTQASFEQLSDPGSPP